jgi:hypothetical protein
MISMLTVRIYNTAGEVIGEGTCSDSGFFPPAVAEIYNAALQLVPPRSLQSCETSVATGDYPEGTRRARFGYSLSGHSGGARILDDEVILHVERA